MASDQDVVPALSTGSSDSVHRVPIRRKPVPTATTFSSNTANKPLHNSEEEIEKYESLRSIKVKPLFLVVDIFLCLTPVSFLVLAWIAYSLDGKELSDFGRNIERWALLSPTIFPLVFSAVVGRALSSLARYKLEKGTSLGVLEQLIGSQTVFGAIWTQWTLRSLNFLGFLLVILWLVSPLGGQASLRLLSEVDHMRQQQTTFAYINMTVTTDTRAQEQAVITLSQSDAIYKACLIAPLSLKNGSQDIWSNVKLPNFGTYNSSLNEAGYATVPEVDVDWVSLVGLPILGPQHDFSSTFNVTWRYHDLSCSPVHKRLANSNWLKDILGDDKSTPLDFWYMSDARAGPGLNVSTVSTTWKLADVQEPTDSLIAPDDNLREFLWLSKSGFIPVDPATRQVDYNETCITKCSLSAHSIETEVRCSGRNCRVTRMKKSEAPESSSDLTQGSTFAWDEFWPGWIMTDARNGQPASSVTEQYIYGRIEAPFQYGAVAQSSGPILEYVDMTRVSHVNFTRRLRTLLNTYYIASLAPSVSTDSLANANVTDILRNGSAQYPGGAYPLSFVATTAELTSSVRVYSCNKVFFTLSFISSCILLIMGFIGTLVKYHCKGPDMFGYVSSVARHNFYSPLPIVQGIRDTDELAKLCKSLVLRLEDVRNGTGDVGHIAVSSLKMKDIRSAWRDSPDRRYK